MQLNSTFSQSALVPVGGFCCGLTRRKKCSVIIKFYNCERVFVTWGWPVGGEFDINNYVREAMSAAPDRGSNEKDNSEEDSASSSRAARGRNLSECSESGTKRQRTLSESFFPDLTSPSPPRFVSLEDIISAANGMANMALAHEIAVDSTFQLEKQDPPPNSVHKHVKDTVVKAFWQVLEQQLNEDPPNYTQGLVLLKDVKEMLMSLMLPHHTKLLEEIEEVLDVDLIRQQVENGTLDFPYYTNFVTSVMAKLCSPARDEKIHTLRQETNTVALFKGILETLELMKIDMANFTIGMYRPLVMASSVDYEKAKFREYLQVNRDGLEATKAWLLRHVTPTTVLSTPEQRRSVISDAYLDLLMWDDSYTFPESLLVDRGRLDDLCKEVLRVSVASAVLLLVVSSVPQVQSRADFKDKLRNNILTLLQRVNEQQDIEEALPHVVLQIVHDCNNTLPEPLTAETKSAVEAQLLQVSASDHRIRLLVFRRIKEFMHATITSTTPSQLQVPAGLSAFTKELSAIAARFHRLVSHNRSVFGDYYTDILESAQST